MNVLLVDDEPTVLEVLALLLKLDGHTVTQAASGEQGVEEFGRTRYDVVVTDQSMPGVDGHQLAASVKATAPDTPVVMISGYGWFDHEAGTLPASVDYILPKPATLEQFRAALSYVAPTPQLAAV
jgi:YesN/AraC family two-component response regulator